MQPPRVCEMLVVDDVPEVLAAMRPVVRRVRVAELRLTIASDPLEALRLLASRGFDLVMSDFRMPRANGVDVLQAARRANPAGYRILMTGYNEIPANAPELRAAALDAHLQKPIGTQDLLLLLHDFLSGDARAIAAHREHARELERVVAPQQ